MHKLTLSFSAARAVFSGLSAHKLLYSSHTKQESLRKYTQDLTKRQLNCYRLQHRTLINVTGNETTSFLQGIITNDASLLEEQGEGVKAMYAQMLNVQGRTLYDIIIYSLKDSQSGLQGVLLECDGSVQESVIKHLKMYKIRRKVNVSSTGLLVWALLPQNKDVLKTFKPDVTVAENVLVLVQDPRTELMGWRLITSHDVNPVEIISACRQGNTEEYHRHRYEIGLPEGVKDLPPGEALPLESNLVYMQGISFTKGCYIGQELTARTHFTGVVRKRLMPVSLSASVENVNQGAALETEEGKPAGKHRAGIGQLGLSLVRTAHAKEPLKLKLSDNTTVTLQATVPEWWPKNTKDK